MSRASPSSTPSFRPSWATHVVNPNTDFEVAVEWEVGGLFAPLWLQALGGNWDVSVYAESLGGGREVRLGSDNTVAASSTTLSYAATIAVPAGMLDEHRGRVGDVVDDRASRVPDRRQTPDTRRWQRDVEGARARVERPHQVTRIDDPVDRTCEARPWSVLGNGDEAEPAVERRCPDASGRCRWSNDARMRR